MKKKLLFTISLLFALVQVTWGEVYILGDINGNNWATNVGVPMTLGEDGLYRATITATPNFSNHYFAFSTKLMDTDNDWNGIAPYRFSAKEGELYSNFVVTDEQLGKSIDLSYEDSHSFQISWGDYNLTLDLEQMTLVIEKLQDDVFILGEVNENDWAPNVGVPMTFGEDGLYTATVTFDGRNEGSCNYFSFTTKLAETSEDWDGILVYRFGAVSEGDFWVLDDHLGQELALSFRNGQAFRITKGEYTMTVNLKDMTLVIEKAPEPAPDVFIIGSVNGNNWASNVGVQMTLGEDGLYTATITADGSFGGYNYFCFTTKLMDTDDDWIGINPYRFGPDGNNNNFAVENEHLGQELPLTFDGSPAFRIPQGEYLLTVDYENMKLIISPVQGISTSITPGIENGQRDSVKGQRDEWYTIDGSKLSGKPTKRGVYIHNGHKIIFN